MRTEDGNIIRQCLDGDSAMFGFLVDKYKRSVYALAYSKVYSFHDAQDITQEVFIKAYRNLHTLKRWDNFMGWISRITLNTCISWIRSESRRPDSEFVEDQKQSSLIYYRNSYHEDNILESIREALDSLPEIYCQVLTLQYFGGMSVDEIAGFLSVSPSTIDRRISEAKTRLREEILTMMNTAGERYELPSAFTFRIVEIVKNIRIHPISPAKPLPLGLSLATGLILLLFGIGSSINLSNQFIPISSMSQNQTPLHNVDNAHIVLSDIPTLSYALPIGGDGDGSGVSGQQDAVLMAPKGEGGEIPDEPSARMGKGCLGYIAYSPDGKILAVSTGLGIRLYDTDNFGEIGTLEEDKVTPGELCFSPDGKILATGNYYGIYLWNMETKRQIGSIKGEFGYVLSFSPDGKILASNGSWTDNTIYLFDVQKLEKIGALKGNTKYIRSICFSPDGNTLISISDRAIRLWDILEQKQMGLLEGHKNEIIGLSVSQDGKMIATTSGDEDEGILLWDIQNRKLIGSLKGHKGFIRSIALNPDGKTLASVGYDDQTIRIWDTKERKEIASIRIPKQEGYSIIFSPDGQELASVNYTEQTIRFWNTQEQKQVRIIDEFNWWLLAVAFSPDGKTIVADHNAAIKFWDVIEQKQIGDDILSSNYYFCGAVAYSPDGKLVAAGSYDGIYLIDAQKMKRIGVLKGHTDEIRSLAFSPDGKLLASGSLDMTLWLWDVEEQKEIKVFRGIPHAHSVAFSPDGNYLICGIGGNGAINIWDVETKELTDVLKPQGSVISIAISPDGKTLASGSGGTITFWDFIEKKRIQTVGVGNIEYIRHLQFSPDSRWLASQSNDGTCRIWDVETRKELTNLKGHKGNITNMAFSQDGKWLATCSEDGTILLWEVDIPVESKTVNPMGKAIDTWGKIKTTDLFQNYPNPFNPETWIPYCLSESENVKIKIYDLNGQIVRKLDLGEKQAGNYVGRDKAAYWDGRNEKGEVVASNTYFYVMEAGDFTETKKMVLMR